MTGSRNPIALGVTVIALAAGTYGWISLKTVEMEGRYLKALQICGRASATGAGAVARLDRTYSERWRERLPAEVREEARACVRAGLPNPAKEDRAEE